LRNKGTDTELCTAEGEKGLSGGGGKLGVLGRATRSRGGRHHAKAAEDIGSGKGGGKEGEGNTEFKGGKAVALMNGLS